MGRAGPGYEWEHVVEQSQINRSGFAPEQVNNSSNMPRVPAWVNRAKNAFYSSKPLFADGMTMREWLTGQSFEFQQAYGLAFLNDVIADR